LISFVSYNNIYTTIIMQLRNGKNTLKLHCKMQRASAIRMPTNDDIRHEMIIELRAMIDEINMRYHGPYMRMRGFCEVYEFLDDNLDLIQWSKPFIDDMRINTIRNITETANISMYHGADPEILDVINILSPKMHSFLSRIGPE
jgi:hypothetical protein